MATNTGIVLFGPPGVGKGVQASLLSKKYGLIPLSTGELIREEIRRGTKLGRKVQDAVARGAFADDETVLGIVMSHIARPEFQVGFVLDGFPRSIPQAEMLDRLLGKQGRKVALALFITAPDEVVLRRLHARQVCASCGATYNLDSHPTRVAGVCDACEGSVARREDDDPAVQRERLQTYRTLTAPLADHYQKAGLLRRVNGDQPVEKVAADIEKLIEGIW